MIGAVAVIAAVQLASASTALEKCRALDKEFDTKNMPKPCQAAADDSTLTIPERVEALRRLAFAHILNGDEGLAEPAFLKMLVFAPSTELPADAGPPQRALFAEVKKRFETEGAIAVKFTPPPPPKAEEPVQITFDVADKLGRVVGARVTSTVAGATLEEKLVRNELEPGQLRFSGAVPEPPGDLPADGRHVEYSVALEGWDTNPIAVPTAPRGSYTRSGKAAAVAEDSFPWLWVGVGSVGVLAVAGAITGSVVYCYNAGPCRVQPAWVRVQIHQNGAP